MNEGELVGIEAGLQRRLVHERAYGVVGQQKSVEFLAYQSSGVLLLSTTPRPRRWVLNSSKAFLISQR